MATKKNTKPATQPKTTEVKASEAHTPEKQKFSGVAKLVGLGLVGLIGVSVLVGLGVIKSPMAGVEIKILGQEAYQQQPRTPLVARSDRNETLTETAITLLNAPEIDKKALGVPVTSETPAAPTAEVEALKTTVEAQQQMLRMMGQQHEEQITLLQAQLQKLGAAFVILQEKTKPADLTSLEKHIARLYLLQGVDRLNYQWQNGILLPETVQVWAQQAAAAGFQDAEKLALALTSMLQDEGLLNQVEVIRAVLALQQTQKEEAKAAAETQGFWAYLKAKLQSLITIEKVPETQTLSTDVITALKAGDFAAFWQNLGVIEGQETPELAQMRQLVESHTSQKFAFDSLYQSLADRPQTTKAVKENVKETVTDAQPIDKGTAE